jgi:hypothetical protein
MEGGPARLEYAGYEAQPAGGRLEFVRREEGVSFVDRPKGWLGREAGGVIAIAVLMFFLAGAGILRGVGARDANVVRIVAIIVATVGLVGALLVMRVRMGRMPVVVGVTDHRLFIVQPSATGQKRAEWEAGELREIEVMPVGTGLNLERLGRVFENYSEPELQWAARILRKEMRMEQAREGVLKKVGRAIGLE